MYSNFFTYYEQDMEKSKLIINYYSNVYQGWHGWWWTMSTITPRDEKLKGVIIIYMVKEILHQLNRFGWPIIEYTYTPQRLPKK